LRAGGYSGTLFASQGFFDATTTVKYKSEAEGLIVSTSMPPLQIAPSIYRIRLDFEQKYGPFTPLSAFSYAAAQIAVGAVRRGGSADRIAVARALNSSMSFDTVIGPISFLNNGDPQDPNVYFYAIKDGKFSYVQAAHRSTFVLK
jgi:ABC-type branched-subunit amino acid transport system substrate-binding protein